jgi:hypothetical protein
MSEEKTWTEEIQTTGEQFVGKIKELVHKGNIRRIIIKNEVRGQFHPPSTIR